jgi:hypothetical protein
MQPVSNVAATGIANKLASLGLAKLARRRRHRISGCGIPAMFDPAPFTKSLGSPSETSAPDWARKMVERRWPPARSNGCSCR